MMGCLYIESKEEEKKEAKVGRRMKFEKGTGLKSTLQTRFSLSVSLNRSGVTINYQAHTNNGRDEQTVVKFI